MVGWKPFAALLLLATLALSGCTGSTDTAPKSRDLVPQLDAQVAQEELADEPSGEPAEEPGEPSQAPPPEPEPQGQPQPDPQEAPEEEQTTTVYEKRLDVLVDQVFYVLPDSANVFTQSFAVEHPYQTLEVVGAYALLPYYADNLQVTVKNPAGETIISYNHLDVLAVITGTGGSTDSFPIGYAYDLELGTYTIHIWGAGTNPVDIKVRGYLGADLDFSFKNVVTGEQDQVANYRGKVVLIDLMATWCGPCKAAMPGLREIRADYEGKVEILSIDVDNQETDAQLKDMRTEYKAEWPFGFDNQGEATDAFGTGWIPSFGIVDQHGVLLYRHIGEMETGELRNIIDYALESR